MSTFLTKIEDKCVICGKTVSFLVPTTGYNKWAEDGEYIQNALPHLSPDQREFMISRICRACFDKTFEED